MNRIGFKKDSDNISIQLALCIVRGQKELMRDLESGDPDSILKDLKAIHGWTQHA